MENININYESLVKTIANLPRKAQRAFFLTACLNEDLSLCQACIDAKVDMKIGDESYGQPFFIDYVEDTRAKTYVVDWLIANGLDINYHSEGYFSPLMAACCHGNVKIVKYLLDKKARIASLDRESNYEGDIYCALCFCKNSVKEMQKYKIVKLLLEAGAPLNVDDASNCNPLYVVIQRKCSAEFVKLFLQYGVSADLVVGGISVLNLAVSKGDYDTVKVLLENGADVNFKMDDIYRICEHEGALNSMDIAIFNKNEEIQNLLAEYGGCASTKEEKLDYLFEHKKEKDLTNIIQKVVRE